MTGKNEAVSGYRRGILIAIRDNSSAYGYSVLITVTLAGIASIHGSPTVTEIAIFLAGAAVAFAVAEFLASRMMRHRLRGERPEAVVLGSAFGIFSIGAGFAAAMGLSTITDEWLVWPIASFTASVTYVLAEGLQILIAERAEENRRSKRRA